MVELVRGNLLEADAEALVNTVNCVGFMGKGIALQFKQAFPENFRFYERACREELVQPGRMLVFETGLMKNPRYIINFPTKRHWRGKSRIEDIESGLTALLQEVRDRKIQSIALPPLGCGHGGLNWSEVRPLIEHAMKSIDGLQVLLYPPEGSPDPNSMPVATARPTMTPARALFVKLMEQYLVLSYRLTLLEVQKLAYFLQEAGEPAMKLQFAKAPYGPYADKLNKVLERIEGHFTRGYGDSQKPDAEIRLLEGAIAEADNFLSPLAESKSRLGRVSRLIEGFETPYGMELLSTVHWVGAKERPPAASAEDAVALVHDWSPRKKNMFEPDHIRVAWGRLRDEGWLPLDSELRN